MCGAARRPVVSVSRRAIFFRIFKRCAVLRETNSSAPCGKAVSRVAGEGGKFGVENQFRMARCSPK